MTQLTLIGPLSQVIPMTGIPIKGAVSDSQIQIIKNAGILFVDGLIKTIDSYKKLEAEVRDLNVK
jgi:imidazolonepropionase